MVNYSGALSKKKKQGVNKMTVTRIKSVKDPLTGEVVGHGQKEIYVQERRDYETHPLTEKEQVQRDRWREACRQASAIVQDKSHPRYMELYHRWKDQLDVSGPCKQFPNFVRHILATE